MGKGSRKIERRQGRITKGSPARFGEAKRSHECTLNDTIADIALEHKRDAQGTSLVGLGL